MSEFKAKALAAGGHINCDGAEFDELYADNVSVHIEMLGDTALYIGLYRDGGNEVVFHGNIGAVRRKGKLKLLVTCNETTLPGAEAMQ